MKKLFLCVLFAGIVLGAGAAEDMMIGNGYIIDEEGMAGVMWDTEAPIPILDLISMDLEKEAATLYYSIDYDSRIEEVQYRDYTDEYGDVGSIEFYSEVLGPVMLHISSDAEVNADELWAVLASYMIDTEMGYLTYICIAATEELQKEEEEADNFNEFVADLKEDYQSEM